MTNGLNPIGLRTPGATKERITRHLQDCLICSVSIVEREDHNVLQDLMVRACSLAITAVHRSKMAAQAADRNATQQK